MGQSVLASYNVKNKNSLLFQIIFFYKIPHKFSYLDVKKIAMQGNILLPKPYSSQSCNSYLNSTILLQINITCPLPNITTMWQKFPRVKSHGLGHFFHVWWIHDQEMVLGSNEFEVCPRSFYTNVPSESLNGVIISMTDR